MAKTHVKFRAKVEGSFTSDYGAVLTASTGDGPYIIVPEDAVVTKVEYPDEFPLGTIIRKRDGVYVKNGAGGTSGGGWQFSADSGSFITTHWDDADLHRRLAGGDSGFEVVWPREFGDGSSVYDVSFTLEGVEGSGFRESTLNDGNGGKLLRYATWWIPENSEITTGEEDYPRGTVIISEYVGGVYVKHGSDNRWSYTSWDGAMVKSHRTEEEIRALVTEGQAHIIHQPGAYVSDVSDAREDPADDESGC